jgi:DNA processing protein
MNNRETLAAYAYMYGGNWLQIERAVKEEKRPEHVQITDPYITILDEQYPQCLLDLKCPPWVLFYQGDIELLQKPKITIVGSREMNDYGKYVTILSADILKQKYVLVSGLAKGVDGCVHRCAVSGGSTIGVIGGGLGTCYPACNRDLYRIMRKDHLILSEYPHDEGVRRYYFPWRNRILAALGQAVIVTQARLNSGTMATVNEALEIDRDVYCFPHPFHDPEGRGCNRLIAEGAMIVYDAEQLTDMCSCPQS